jgi:hypothetical protein
MCTYRLLQKKERTDPGRKGRRTLTSSRPEPLSLPDDLAQLDGLCSLLLLPVRLLLVPPLLLSHPLVLAVLPDGLDVGGVPRASLAAVKEVALELGYVLRTRLGLVGFGRFRVVLVVIALFLFLLKLFALCLREQKEVEERRQQAEAGGQRRSDRPSAGGRSSP